MLKKVALVFIVVITFLVILFVFFDEPLPKGEDGGKAERLADKMLKAVNYAAWDSTVAVKWSFPGGHAYLWDKKRKLVQVEWENFRVLLNTDDLSGKAFRNGHSLQHEKRQEALQKAWKLFSNDSFWLAAPFKVRDPGTERSLIRTPRGDALLVHYTSGGVTPGDRYLWFLNASGLPVAWKLWVRIIPIGGIEFSWEDWQVSSTGAKLSSFHKGVVDIQLSGIQVGMDVKSLNNGLDPFTGM